MRISKFLKNPTVRLLIYLFDNEKARYRDLSQIIGSRGTLSNSLNALLYDELVQRLVNAEKIPIESYYFLTEKGRKVAFYLKNLIEIFEL